MIVYSMVLFSIAVLIGMYMIYLGLRFHRGSLALGLSHAAFAVLGLILLVVALFREPGHSMVYNDSALAFVLTFAGGVVLLALREGRKPPPMVVVGVHAFMALFGLMLLIIAYRT